MFRRFVAWFNGGKLVTLVDFEEDVYRTIAYYNYEKQRWEAYVYWFFKIGYVILNKNGTLQGKSSYIRHWIFEGKNYEY
jgi:hypothetical protein